MAPLIQLDYHVAPIRTFEQIAAEMRRRGDLKMNARLAEYYHRQALGKLRAALQGWKDHLP